MARYFFHLHNDVETYDEEGRECDSIEAAREAAISEARVMASSSVLEGHLVLSHNVAVTDARGRQVLVVRFGDAVSVQP
jgi:hypothetical protein